MSLKNKLILLLIISGIILISLLYTAFLLTIRPSQDDQKAIFVEKLKQRMRIALAVEEKNLTLLSANWADWESMAHYVLNPTTEFESDVFPNEIFNEDMLDIVLVTRLEDSILYYKGYKNRWFLDLGNMNIIPEINKIRTMISRTPRVIKAVISSGAGPLMIVATPIKTGSIIKRTVGILFLGRFIDEKMLTKISDNTMETVRALRMNEAQLKEFSMETMKGKDLYFEDDKDKLTVYHLLKDINNKPALVIYTNSDNEIFKVMNQHIITLVIFIFLSIIFLGLRLYFSIDKQIVKRVLNISGTMNQIEGLEDLSKRIPREEYTQKDEISHLIDNINNTLDKLENEKKNREIAEHSMITHGKLASIGRLASCIGHEVNNPLLAISNSIQVIKKLSRSKSENFKEAVEISESEINRIRNIISSLLDFHRFQKETYSRIDVSEIISQSLNILEMTKKLGETDVIRRFNKNCSVCGSPDRLKQVFMNFILNAVEAMEGFAQEPSLIIRVACSDDNQYVEIHFIDNGPGIPDDIKGHLFEPFVSTKEVKGVGLGLYISYKIIDSHKGVIIYNDQYQSGTHFIIKLPIKTDGKCEDRIN